MREWWVENVAPLLGTISLDNQRLGIEFVAIVVVIASFPPILNSILRIVRKSLLSETELAKVDVVKELQVIRRKMENEKDKEVVKELKLHKGSLEREYAIKFREGMRDEDGDPVVLWNDALISIRDRLFKESERLVARSTSNLSYGIVISIIGIIFLLVTIFAYPPHITDDSTVKLIVEYGPRISIVLIIEGMAAFFLRMYVATERNLIRNNNELTNIELRFSAGLMVEKCDDALEQIAMNLSTEERNFVLKKSETAKPDNANAVESMDKAVDVVARVAKELKSS